MMFNGLIILLWTALVRGDHFSGKSQESVPMFSIANPPVLSEPFYYLYQNTKLVLSYMLKSKFVLTIFNEGAFSTFKSIFIKPLKMVLFFLFY